VNKQRADISQIQAYLNGKLDAKAMHRLEREAQDDPFLMDAIEGYQTAGQDQQDNLTHLSHRLNLRVNKKERRIIPWITIAIAAGVIGFMVVIGLFNSKQTTTTEQQTTALNKQQPATPVTADTARNTPPVTAQPEPQIAYEVPASQVPQRKKSPVIAAVKKPVKSNYDTAAEPTKQMDLAEVMMSANTGANKDSSSFDDRVMNLLAKKKDSTDMPQEVAIATRALSQTLNGKAKGVIVNERQGKRESENAYYLGTINPALKPGQLVLPGSAVTNRADDAPKVNTDVKAAARGAAGLDDKIDVKGNAILGYFKPVTDSIKLNNSSLNEVVIVSPEAAAGINKATSLGARPRIGWSYFKRYLKKSAVLPAGAKAGTVKLNFTVNANGSITDIKILKSLSPVADEQAVSIIRNGPHWIGNANEKAEVVTMDVVFEVGNKE